MTDAIDDNLKIYTDYGDFEGNDHEFDDYVRFLLGKKMIYIRKEPTNILIAVTGVHCHRGSTPWNCFFFYRSSYPKNQILHQFANSLEEKCKRLGLVIDEDRLKEIFTSNSKKGDISSVRDKIGKGIIPSFDIPIESTVDIIEKTMELKNVTYIGFNFGKNEISGLNELDILYNYGYVKEITPTLKTKQYFYEKERERQLIESQKDKKQLQDFKKEIDTNIYNVFKNSYRMTFVNYCSGALTESIMKGKLDKDTKINLLTNDVLSDILDNFINALKKKFEDFIKEHNSDNFKKFFNDIELAFEEYRSVKFSQLIHHNMGKQEKINEKMYLDIKDIIDTSFAEKLGTTESTKAISQSWFRTLFGSDPITFQEAFHEDPLFTIFIFILSILLGMTIFYTLFPPALTVTVLSNPATVIAGIPTSMTFAVTYGSENISGATLILTGAATGSGTTDESGKAVISVNAASAGDIIATATKSGFTSGNTKTTVKDSEEQKGKNPTPTPTQTTPIPTITPTIAERSPVFIKVSQERGFFTPYIQIKVGYVVYWNNDGNTTVTLVSDEFGEHQLNPRFNHTFTKSGIYEVYIKENKTFHQEIDVVKS